MVAMLSLNGSDDVAASWHQHGMIIAMLDRDDGCKPNFLVTLCMATSAVAADLRSTISKRAGQSW